MYTIEHTTAIGQHLQQWLLHVGYIVTDKCTCSGSDAPTDVLLIVSV